MAAAEIELRVNAADALRSVRQIRDQIMVLCATMDAAADVIRLSPDTFFDFQAHLQRQREFSLTTFGPGLRTAGVLDHIRKELDEITANPTDLMEWIDVVILGLDGALRTGASPNDIAAALLMKQRRNESRVWPDWRTQDPDKAIEHNRNEETTDAC